MTVVASSRPKTTTKRYNGRAWTKHSSSSVKVFYRCKYWRKPCPGKLSIFHEDNVREETGIHTCAIIKEGTVEDLDVKEEYIDRVCMEDFTLLPKNIWEMVSTILYLIKSMRMMEHTRA
jgi:hypothetical protein